MHIYIKVNVTKRPTFSSNSKFSNSNNEDRYTWHLIKEKYKYINTQGKKRAIKQNTLCLKINPNLNLHRKPEFNLA